MFSLCVRAHTLFSSRALCPSLRPHARSYSPHPTPHTIHTQFEYWTNRGLAFEALAESMLAEGNERDACQFYETAMISYDHAIILNPENHRCARVGLT